MHQKQLSSVSIVVPVFNELENIRPAYDEICQVMDSSGRRYNIVFVDDGSTDETRDELVKVAVDPKVQLILLRRNYGQTAAMHAGIQHATGDYIVTIDGDLQNDPANIPEMLARLDEGYDLVHGWRKNRQDKLWSRKIPSRLANRLISRTTGFAIHDLGCTMKAIKSSIAKELELYGEMHRFIPILASNLGGKCLEVEVNHRARKFGTSKYGINRTVRVLLDLVTVFYLRKYFASPMKLFGLIGCWIGLLAFASLLAAASMKVFWHVDVTGNPVSLLCILTSILSAQFLSLGLLGELAVRIYYSMDGNRNYHVRELVNMESATVRRAA